MTPQTRVRDDVGIWGLKDEPVCNPGYWVWYWRAEDWGYMANLMIFKGEMYSTRPTDNKPDPIISGDLIEVVTSIEGYEGGSHVNLLVYTGN